MLRIYLSFAIFIGGLSLTQAMAGNPSGFALVGVITDHNAQQSIAVISTSNRQTLFLHIGDQVPGLQSYRVSQIGRNQVILSDGRQEMRLEHSGTSAVGGSGGGLASAASRYNNQGGLAWSDDREAMMHHRSDFLDEVIIDDYQDQAIEPDEIMEMGGGQDVRARQIPGLILRNRGQAIDEPSYGYDD